MALAKTKADEPQKILTLARQVLSIEADAVAALAERLDENFVMAVNAILRCRGRVVVSGMGKSGHIATKIASTLASTGTPAFFVHPGDASHGDLGMIASQDIVIMLSNSGESEELIKIVPLIKRRGAKLIALTGNVNSTLAKEADVHLDAAVAREACPLELAPTASTTAALALGDALALALLDARGFSSEDFAHSHPGGALGRKLLTHVGDVMRTGERVPKVTEGASVAEAILEISSKGMGMTAVLNHDQRVAGIFTDGDLRRAFEKISDLRATAIGDVMTRNPRTISADRLAVEAAEVMETHKINQLLVVDAELRLRGALNTHDLMLARVI
ncbi:MAG: KpsF/GutQ family sugar-phosphate isomerase [Burkholderiales bacterium]